MTNKVSAQQIIEYFDDCEIDYRLFWNLDKSYAMHFGFWDEKVKNFPQALQRENEILAEIAKISSADTVLDAGCGVGGSAIFLSQTIGCQTVGITLSAKQAAKAAFNAKKNGVGNKTKFLVMDFEHMTFPANTFDVVWAIESVCYAQDKQKFINEAKKVLKPGGRLIVADAYANKKNFSKQEKELMDLWLSGWGVAALETKSNFATFLKDAGFKNISAVDMTKQVTPSSKRLYHYARMSLAVGKIAEFFKIRKKVQTGNIIAAFHQHEAVVKNLIEYVIFCAEKK